MDKIDPANEAQEKLISLWKNSHLTKVDEDETGELINEIVAEIEEAEEERKGQPLSELEEVDLLKLIEDNTDFTDSRDIELCAAICLIFDLTENDLGDVEIEDTRVTIQGTDYLAGTDEEMNEAWDESLENYLDECVLPELPETAQRYFDKEAWKSDARHDGRGHSLNSYDGGEEERKVNGTYYYAYQN